VSPFSINYVLVLHQALNIDLEI